MIAPEKALEKGSQLIKDITKAANALKGKVSWTALCPAVLPG